MNTVMQYTIIFTVWITKSVSKTEEEARKTVFVYITAFANMSLIPIIVYRTKEIDEEWYKSVGVGILSNFLLYPISCNLSGFIYPFVKLIVGKLQANFLAVDQEDYNF